MIKLRVMTMDDYDEVIDLMKNTPASNWQNQGWQLRTDIDGYSLTRSGSDNA
jgi:hypothetical protein